MSIVFADEFQLASTTIGVLIGALFVAQGLGQLPGGAIVDRFGPSISISSGCLVAALGCALVGLADEWLVVAAGRVLIGAGFAPTLLSCTAYLVNWGGNARLSTMTGRLLFVGMSGGVIGTGPLAIAIEAWGWRNVYLVIALITAALAIGGLLVMRDYPPGTIADHRSNPRTLRQSLSGLREIMSKAELRPLLIIAPFLYAPAQVLVGLWAGPYLADIHGLDATERGYALTVMMAGMGLGVLSYGPVETRVGRRRPVVMTGALAVAASLTVLVVFGQSAVWIAVLACVLCIVFSTFFVVVIAHAQSMFPAAYSGRSVAAIGILGVSGVFVMQSLTAALLSYFPGNGAALASLAGYRLVFGLLALIFVGVALVYSSVPEG